MPALASTLSMCVLSTNMVRPADLPPVDTMPAAGSEIPAHWFLRLGALGVIEQSSSQLFAQPLVYVVAPGVGSVPVGGGGPDFRLPGRGATYSNLMTVGIEGGYFVTPNWSLDISTGIPTWTTVKITGIWATPPYSGTVLSSVMLTTNPITIDYHFAQFGQFQPYLGGDYAERFSCGLATASTPASRSAPALGVVLQGGFDYMLNRNWGVFFDAKKIFIRGEGKSTGLNLGPPLGTIPASGKITTDFEPWLLTAGLTYRF